MEISRLMMSAVSVFLCLLIASTAGIVVDASDDTTTGQQLIILHTNDMHSQFAQMDKDGNECTTVQDKAKECYGGFARILQTVRQFRNDSAHSDAVLFLNAGDTYSGTNWFAAHGGRIVTDFMNLLKPDVACLGNHEFDLNVKGLLPYLRDSRFPHIAANLDLAAEPRLAAERNLRRSIVLPLNGRNNSLGIVGYLTPDTKRLAPPNAVVITDVVAAVNAEAARLRATGVRTIIALGHAGLPTDRRVAAECPEIDAVVGGHDNTFLWNGAQPNVEKPKGPYPLVVTQASGKRVPVVQAYAFTKYMGVLRLQLSPTGAITSFSGQPLLMDGSVPQDPEALVLLERYRPTVAAYERQPLGRTNVWLNATSSRTAESCAGNLVTDALVHAHAMSWRAPADGTAAKQWTDCAIAFLNSGGINLRLAGGRGNVSVADVMRLLPYENGFVSVWLSGREIWRMLEHSVARYNPNYTHGEYLQMSGVRVLYNVSQPVERRVVEVRVLCTECEVPLYEPLRLLGEYKVIVTDFMSQGGDGYSMMQQKRYFPHTLSVRQALQQYITQLVVVHPVVEERIRFVETVTEAGKTSAAARCRSMAYGLAMAVLIWMTVLTVA